MGGTLFHWIGGAGVEEKREEDVGWREVKPPDGVVVESERL